MTSNKKCKLSHLSFTLAWFLAVTKTLNKEPKMAQFKNKLQNGLANESKQKQQATENACCATSYYNKM